MDGAGNQANGGSTGPSISADGRFVAFISSAPNLVPNDTNPSYTEDAFVKDRATGEVRRVSVDSDGGQTKGVDSANIIHTAISDDGRFVAFNASLGGAVVYDRESGQVRTVGGLVVDMSGDGRFIALAGGSTDILRDLVGGDRENLPAGSRLPSLSYDARFVAHIDSEGRVAVLDRQSGETEVVGLNSSRQVIGLNNWPSISNDGRYVAFESYAPNVAPGDTPDTPDVFVRDRQTEETTLVSKDAEGKPSGGVLPQISPDGRHVVYSSSYMIGQSKLLIHDLDTGITQKVSIDSYGEDANDDVPGITGAPQDLSADGRFIVFESNATNLVEGDSNGSSDIFVHDRKAPQLGRVSVGDSGYRSLPAPGGAPGSGDETGPLLMLMGLGAMICGGLLAAGFFLRRR